MLSTITVSTERRNDIVEGLKRTMSVRELAWAIVLDDSWGGVKIRQTEKEKKQERARMVNKAVKLSNTLPANMLVEECLKRILENGMGSSDGTQLYVDKSGEIVLDLDQVALLRMGDALREADYRLTGRDFKRLNQHFVEHAGYTLDDLFNEEEAGIISYPLSDGSGVIQITSMSREEGVELEITDATEQTKVLWTADDVAGRLATALTEQMLHLSDERAAGIEMMVDNCAPGESLEDMMEDFGYIS